MDIKILFPIVIAVVGWIIAIWQTINANRNKKDAVIFENRLKIYNEYFKKIDDINGRLMIDFQDFIGPTIGEVFEKILKDPENSTTEIIKMQGALSDMISKSSKTITQATQELQNLRFIASQKTLKILDEYKILAESQVNILPEILATIDFSRNQNFDLGMNNNLKEVGQKLLETRNLLEKQMREDLGLD